MKNHLTFFLLFIASSIFSQSKSSPFKNSCPDCYKSQSRYTVIDNSKTRFTWTMDLLVTLSNGSTEIITQTPTTGYSEQLLLWRDLFDELMSSKCDSYVVEPRCNIPNGCGGLDPPPSEILGTIPEMFWGYLQISACSTCPSIINVEILSIDGVDQKPRPLIMKFQDGKEKRYSLCEDCGKSGKLYYFDTDSLVLDSDIPLCLFKCSESFPSPPATVCAFVSKEGGCDNMGTENIEDDQRLVRICELCDGEQTCTFFTEQPDGSLNDYPELVGNYVECGTNSIVPEPEIKCDSVAIKNLPLAICQDKCAESAIRVFCGRPNNEVSYSYGGIEAVSINAFNEAWEAAGYKTWISDKTGTAVGGECHFFCPTFDTPFLIDGMEVGEVISPNPSAAIIGCEDKEALFTSVCQADLDYLISGIIQYVTKQDCDPYCDELGNTFKVCDWSDGSVTIEDLFGNQTTSSEILPAVCTGTVNILNPDLSCILVDGNGVEVPLDWATRSDDEKVEWVLSQYGMNTYSYIDQRVCVPNGDQVAMSFCIGNCGTRCAGQFWTASETNIEFQGNGPVGSLSLCCCDPSSSPSNFWGMNFPSSPEPGELYIRTDLANESFTFDQASGKWIGELVKEGYGDSGSLTDNQYFRRYNGMGTGPDRGVGFPYDILVLEHGVNWETPNTNTGSIEIETGGNTVLNSLPTIGDGPAHQNTSFVLPANSILSFRRNGQTINNTQGFIVYRKCLN